MPLGFLEVVLRVSGGFLSGVFKVSGRCLGDVWRGSKDACRIRNRIGRSGRERKWWVMSGKNMWGKDMLDQESTGEIIKVQVWNGQIMKSHVRSPQVRSFLEFF